MKTTRSLLTRREWPYAYSVEANMPMPSRAVGRKPKYPFPEMKVGDSFFVPDGGTKGQTVRMASYHYGKRHGGQVFSTLKDGDGYRCWRIK